MKTITLPNSLITKETEKAIFATYHTDMDNIVIEGWFPKSRIEVLPPSMEIVEGTLKSANEQGFKFADLVVEPWLLKDKRRQLFNPKFHYAK